MATSLAELLQRFGEEYLRTRALSTVQAKAWRAIISCRTPAMGGQLLQCDHCSAQQWRWHSCRNRHCPRCQARSRDAWRAARMAELLDVPYCHLVFTLPHELNALAGYHPRWVYDVLMRSAASTLTDFAANPRWLGGVGAFTLVLHTWTQDLRRHLHVHALMACGAMRGEGDDREWVRPSRGERFLFPVQALSRVFRGKFIQALLHAQQQHLLPRDPAGSDAERAERLRLLRRHDWVVYAKTPLAGPAAVLDYLSRYTHRTAIGDERLQAIEGHTVRIRVRGHHDAHEHAGGKRTAAMDGVEFIGRLVQHVLPSGFKRIRHYGLLAPAGKAAALAKARALLDMPAVTVRAREDAQAFMRRVAAMDIERCPHCASGRWTIVREIAGSGLLHLSGHAFGCRGPP